MIDPLNRRPRLDRLTVAVRGAAGTGKSTFAATAQELPQRLLFLDLEGKARLLPGATHPEPPFDAVEIRSHDEIPQVLDWALEGDGRERNYATIAFDSWGAYFGEAYSRALKQAETETGHSITRLTAEQEQTLQARVQDVLRRLCYQSGMNIIITDHIAARGKEDQEANEVGRIVPLTASGLEYMIDVMLELDLVINPDELSEKRIATVVKSNVPNLPIGTQIEDPTFPKLLELAGAPDKIDAPTKARGETRTEAAPENEHPDPATDKPTAADLIKLAQEHGFKREQVVLVAQRTYGKSTLETLTLDERKALEKRIRARGHANRAA